MDTSPQLPWNDSNIEMCEEASASACHLLLETVGVDPSVRDTASRVDDVAGNAGGPG
jgi:hypothetical protein